MASDFLAQETIRRKRDGMELDDAEIEAFVRGVSDDSITDSQISAFAMAVYFQDLSTRERVALTQAMVASGETMRWHETDQSHAVDGPIVDKHSTGGIGDKVSLVLAPIVAACGAYVPMISGRGLGHTGGTLDKLDSIPGYDTAPSRQRFTDVVRRVGCAIIGQTTELAPADRRIYAIRDITATVESIALITASILSKKLAAGLDALVMDVKFGSGAFMQDLTAARELATSIVTVATGAGTPTTALLSDMNQVLGHSAGNAVEVRESIQFLIAERQDRRLRELTLALAAEMLLSSGLASSTQQGLALATRALDEGAAAVCFAKMVAALGGPADLLERCDDYLPTAAVQQSLQATRAGVISHIDVRALGIAVINLGGGRRRNDEAIDHSVGLTEVCGLGTQVDAGQPLAIIHAASDHDARRVLDTLQAAISISDHADAPRPIVHERITA